MHHTMAAYMEEEVQFHTFVSIAQDASRSPAADTLRNSHYLLHMFLHRPPSQSGRSDEDKYL